MTVVKRRKLLPPVLGAFAVASTLGVAMPSASAATAGVTASTAKLPFAGQTLLIADWQGYVADLSWVDKEFEQQTGATVKFVYFNSDSDEVTLLKNGGVGKVDVTLPNIAYVQLMAAEGLLQPIDVAKVSDYSQLDAKLRTQPSLVYQGKTYSVPWAWGSTSLVYNPKTVKAPIDSWSALWDPKFKGQIAFYNDPQTAIETAAIYLHENPYNPNLNKVQTALMALKKNVKLFWTSSNDLNKAWTDGSVEIANDFSGSAGDLAAQKVPIDYVFPSEGYVGWMDTWAIVKNAPNPALAYKWIDFMSSAPLQERAVNSGEYAGPANDIAIKALTPPEVSLVEAPAASLSHLVLQVAIPPARLQAWTNLWNEVLAS
jgi:spermidine/putrescine transport system substrate-binding protein